jgi:hypothetical protein
MTPEQINSAIAGACGWKLDRVDDGEFQLRNPKGVLIVSDCDPSTTFESFSYKFPNYCNSLDAMHEAEKSLDWANIHDWNNAAKYIKNLCEVTGGDYYSLLKAEVVCATAAQRAEAFLKTIGKWVY